MNIKNTIVSIIAVFVAWTAIDFYVHGFYLSKTYEATASLWRPHDEMKQLHMFGSRFIVAAAFVLIYAMLIGNKGFVKALAYGLLSGIASGTGMGLGTFSYMPISEFLATSWAVSELVKYGVAGFVLGWCFRPNSAAAE